jgi:hypothetical protein
MKEAAYIVEQFLRQKNVDLKVISTDTWPSNKKFWKLLFGPQLLDDLAYGILLNGLLHPTQQSS